MYIYSKQGADKGVADLGEKSNEARTISVTPKEHMDDSDKDGESDKVNLDTHKLSQNTSSDVDKKAFSHNKPKKSSSTNIVPEGNV